MWLRALGSGFQEFAAKICRLGQWLAVAKATVLALGSTGFKRGRPSSLHNWFGLMFALVGVLTGQEIGIIFLADTWQKKQHLDDPPSRALQPLNNTGFQDPGIY